MEHTVSNDLLQYADPIEITHAAHEPMKKIKQSVAVLVVRPSIAISGTFSFKSTVIEPTKEEIDQCLYSIFPQEEFDDYEGNSYIQKISTKPAALEDVKAFEQELDFRMRNRHARPDGLCPIRRELFVQAFNELVRQETIDCPERGLLLRRIRDQIRQTFSVFRSLYESSIAYISRKSVMLEATEIELEKTIQENEPGLIELRKKFKEMTEKVEAAEFKVVDQAELYFKRRKDEVEFHKTIGAQLRVKDTGRLAREITFCQNWLNFCTESQLDKILVPKKNV